MSYSKSQVIPESYRANVMNWFRVPMNIITCAALLCLRVDWISYDKRFVFGACLIISFLGLWAINDFISMTATNGGGSGEEVQTGTKPKPSAINELKAAEEAEVTKKLLDA